MGWTVQELDELLVALPPGERVGRTKRARSARRTTPVPESLPKPLRRLLAAPVPERGVSSRFHSLVLLCIELALPVEVVHAVLLSHEPSVGKYGAQLEVRADALLEKHPHLRSDCISARCANAPGGGGSSQEEVRRLVRAWRAAAQQYPWPRRKRHTALAVLGVHFATAEKVGSLEYDLDRRRMVEAAGVSRTTADARVHEFLGDGWLVLAEGDCIPIHALTYRLVCAPLGPQDPHSLPDYQPPATQLCGPTKDNADVWRNGAGLGKSRRQTWIALIEGANTVDLLVKVTGLTQRTVRQHLVRFNQLVMAGPTTEDLWHGEWEPFPVDWERLEQHLGVRGYRDRQVQRHRRESEQHQRYVQSGGRAWSNRPSKKPYR